MNRLPGTCLVALALMGCATAPGDNVLATTAPQQECKAVAVYSASEQLHNQIHGAAPASSLAQTQGVAGVAKTKIPPEPRALRSTPGTTLVDKTLHDC